MNISDYLKFEKANSRRITNLQLLPLISEIVKASKGHISEIIEGLSVEHRPIHSLTWGNGPIKILMWSQMHGNEPTATLALLDLFYEISSHPEKFSEIENQITICAIPMLNPDGAERFQRRNALGIDLNRDALHLTSPESKILYNKRQSFQPDWGFNLHDQNSRYSAGKTQNQAMISLLAPAFSSDLSDNPVRLKAKQLCAAIHQDLLIEIGPHIGKYDDAFGERCFGDNMQKWGVSTILVESGGYKMDLHKDAIRQLNVRIYKHAIKTIMSQSFTNYTVNDYDAIPFNGSVMTDLKISGSCIEVFNKKYPVELAVNFSPMMNHLSGREVWVGKITEIGDLRSSRSFETVDFNSFVLKPMTVMEIHKLPAEEDIKLHILSGIECFIVETTNGLSDINIPVNFILNGQSVSHHPKQITIGERASFLVYKENKLHSVWINGFEVYSEKNGWIPKSPILFANGTDSLEVEL